jgi:hypothetical protein
MGSYLEAPEKELTEQGKCELLGMFGFFIQFSLGIICFSILFIKRQLEKPKRYWKIWLMDISKQGISTLLLHFFNLFFSVAVSSENEDQCVWYLNNVLLDGTIGVLFQWILVRCLEILARKLEIDALTSGCYFSYEVNEFSERTLDYSIWGSQMGIWCLISTISKTLIYIILNVWIDFFNRMGTDILSKFNDPKLELIFVMIVVPSLTSCFQYWITDNFLKESDESRIERLGRGQDKLEQIGPDHFEQRVEYNNEVKDDNMGQKILN